MNTLALIFAILVLVTAIVSIYYNIRRKDTTNVDFALNVSMVFLMGNGIVRNYFDSNWLLFSVDIFLFCWCSFSVYKFLKPKLI